MDRLPIKAEVFHSLLNYNLDALSKFAYTDIHLVAPYLLRILLSANSLTDDRNKVLTLLNGDEHINSLIPLYLSGFSSVVDEVKKDSKLRNLDVDSNSETHSKDRSDQDAVHLKFEQALYSMDFESRIKIVVSEFLSLSAKFQRTKAPYLVTSELLDCNLYFREICEILCVILYKCPWLLELRDIVKVLLRIRNGPHMICVIVANVPHRFKEVCDFLIKFGDKKEDDRELGKVKLQTIRLLCEMNPDETLTVRRKCVELCRMPALAILLSLDYDKRNLHTEKSDLVRFLLSILLGHSQQVRMWFASYIYNSQKGLGKLQEAYKLLCTVLLKHLDSVAQKCCNKELPADCILETSSLIRLYCALKEMAKYKLKEEEKTLIVEILTSHPPPSLVGTQFLSLGLAVFIGVPSLLNSKIHEALVLKWMKWFVQTKGYIESGDGSLSSFGEILLLIAIHFHNKKLSAICDLASSVLGMKLHIRNSSLVHIKRIFIEEVFTEKTVTMFATKVPVTCNLNANMPGFLSVHCIHQLLKGQAFTKHKVSIQNWIYRQICNSIAPIHPVIPAVVQLFVNNLLLPSTKFAKSFIEEPFSEAQILEVFSKVLFKPNETENPASTICIEMPSITPLLLFMYYVLLYKEREWSNLSNENSLSQETKGRVYSVAFMSELPFRYLLQEAQKDQKSYAVLLPQLVRLLTTHFPHLLLVSDWMKNDAHYNVLLTHKTNTRNFSSPISSDTIVKAFMQMKTYPSQLRKVLEDFLEFPPCELWKFASIIVAQIKDFLDDDVQQSVKDTYKKVWLSLNNVLPQKLCVMTINALLYDEALRLTEEDLMLNPLLILSCDRKVSRCAPVLEIILRILEAILVAAKSYAIKNVNVHMQSYGDDNADISSSEYESLVSSFVATQESAAVQSLLEYCLETEEDKEKIHAQWALREVQGMICSFLHNMFINDPSLLKLVHFQGYPQELLAVTVQGIPSMHICMDFIPELFSQPSAHIQVFAIDLTSHIAQIFRIPKCLNVANLALEVVKILSSTLPMDEFIQTCNTVVASLKRLCKAFPILVDDILKLLMNLGFKCESHVSVASVELPRSQNITDITSSKKFYSDIQETICEILKVTVFSGSIY